jgi:PAS domain S-box-containing protein
LVGVTHTLHVEPAESVYRQLVEFAFEPMAIVTERGVVAFVNDATLKLVDRPFQECIGEPFTMLLHPDDRERAEGLLNRAIDTVDDPVRDGFRVRRRDGRTLSIETIIRCIVAGDSRLGLIHSRDVSEREHLEARLRHAQKLSLLGRLAAGLTDDFEQVVTTIRGHLPGIIERAAQRPALLGVHAIARATEKAATLTRQLRVFVETTPLLLEPTDLHQVLEEVRRLSAGEVWIDAALNAPRTSIRTDRAALTLGLRDLMLSLRHETPEPTVVSVATRNVHEMAGRSGGGRGWTDYLVIEVHNGHDGLGAQSGGTFLDASADATHSALRLALVILDDIVNASGGWIEVASTEAGGTAVRVLLPLE